MTAPVGLAVAYTLMMCTLMVEDLIVLIMLQLILAAACTLLVDRMLLYVDLR